MLSRLARFATGLFAACALALTARAADAGTGSIAGAISSSQTRNALQGATVTIPSLNRTVLTDESGRFLISNVPPGVAEVIVSYTGFEEARQQVNVTSGGLAQVELQLKSSGVVQMAKPLCVKAKEETR